ncbi:MAG: MlaD family protein [Oligoflexales bacterium]
MNNLGVEFRVGIFTILGIAVTAFAVFVLNPDLFDTKEKTLYYTVLNDASGIMPKTHVKTNGVIIGKVTSVELLLNSTKITMEVDRKVKIPQGSTVEIRTVGFLGDKFIEIQRTDDDTAFIQPGQMIPKAEGSMELNEVISVVGGIAKDIKTISVNLSKTLGGNEGERNLKEIVDNVKEFTKQAKEILSENRNDVRSLVLNLENFSKSVNEVLDNDNKEKIDRILASFDRSMEEVEGATKNIKLISEKVEKGEGTLGRLINDDKMMSELEGAITDLREVLAPVSKLQVKVDYHGEFRRDDSKQHYLNILFYTRPNNYYVLGLTDQKDEIVTTRTEGLPDNTQRETIRREKPLKFNLQFGKRWYWAGLRFGLFESTGGLGSDLYFFKDNLRFTAEAFDFASKDDPVRKGAHLKAYASVLFFNHVYTMFGVDDITRLDVATGKVNPDPNYFFGAGLSFDDQDLKSMFGAAALASP